MAATYSSFLQSPSTGHLAHDASLNYITTTTVISEPTAILKHLQAQLKQVTKKEEKVLNAIEGPDSLCLETQLTIQFNNGGGAYLPSMDENLLDEKTVTFPLLHVVNFDGEQKIKQIRLHWDQGTLLKQVEAIGRTGRNWPIRDGKAQVDAITKSLKSSGIDPKAPLASRDPNEVVINQHKRTSVSATRDPHASLNLFAPRDPNIDEGSSYEGPTHAPRASAKPAPRDYGELFASQDSPAYNNGTAADHDPTSKARSPSPSKVDGVILKSGAGKHYTGNRLFDDSEQSGIARSPERKKTYEQKYQHFAFGDGEDVPVDSRPMSGGRGTKAQPTFSFEDFATPPKVAQKARKDHEVHWGADDPPSPPKRPVVHAARKDADPHFAFTDDSSPANSGAKSLQRQKGMGLYQDPIMADERTATSKSPRNPTTTSVDNSRRGNDFGAHYSMTDSPHYSQTGKKNEENMKPSVGGKRNDMDAHWSFETPPKARQIYKTAGDGMGGRKASGRAWGIGDESDPEVDKDVRPTARSRRAQALAGAEDGDY